MRAALISHFMRGLRGFGAMRVLVVEDEIKMAA